MAYQHWLLAALTENDCALHAYVLMTNHVHLLITPTRVESISRLMMSLGRRYVQFINKSGGRTGTLWDGRYKSSLIDSEHYLLRCQRYIEMNPVRARMVDDPAHYRWSSYRGNALGEAVPLLTPHGVYEALGGDVLARSEHYRALFRTQSDQEPIDDIRLALQQSQAKGDSRFVDKIEQIVGHRQEVAPRGQPRKPVAGKIDTVKLA